MRLGHVRNKNHLWTLGVDGMCGCGKALETLDHIFLNVEDVEKAGIILLGFEKHENSIFHKYINFITTRVRRYLLLLWFIYRFLVIIL